MIKAKLRIKKGIDTSDIAINGLTFRQILVRSERCLAESVVVKRKRYILASTKSKIK